jgi:hypothetical protein
MKYEVIFVCVFSIQFFNFNPYVETLNMWSTAKPANVVTSIKQSPLLKGYIV